MKTLVYRSTDILLCSITIGAILDFSRGSCSNFHRFVKFAEHGLGSEVVLEDILLQ